MHGFLLLRSVRFEYDPSSHGSAALAPAGQYEPGSQGLHSVCCSLSWYVPAAHGAQSPMRRSVAIVPGRQGLGAVLPVVA